MSFSVNPPDSGALKPATEHECGKALITPQCMLHRNSSAFARVVCKHRAVELSFDCITTLTVSARIYGAYRFYGLVEGLQQCCVTALDSMAPAKLHQSQLLIMFYRQWL